MAKNWYPIINKDRCIKCGACIKKCKNNVYDKTSNIPIVLNKDNCIEGCQGCSKLCPVKAITYSK